MSADCIFLGTDSLELFQRVAVALKADMFIFAQVGKSLSHNHEDMGLFICIDRNRLPLQGFKRVRDIAIRLFDLHGVCLMQERINQPAGSILVDLKIGVAYCGKAVIKRLAGITEIQQERAEQNAADTFQPGLRSKFTPFGKQKGQNQQEQEKNNAESSHKQCKVREGF